MGCRLEEIARRAGRKRSRAIESNIVLNKDIYQVRYINMEGNTYIVTVNDGRELDMDTRTDTDVSPEEKPHTE